MKKIYLILIVLITGFVSCTDQFADFNTDKKNPAVVPGEMLFSNGQKELSDFVNNTNVNINIFKLMAQYWTETTYVDETNYDLITRNISTNIYLRLYLRVLKDLNESSKIITATDVLTSQEAVKANKLAIIELVNVYAYSQLVDVFGNIPYTQALDPENVYPVYDDAHDIYKDLLVRLDAALGKLDAGAESFGSADLYYGGDVAAWVKFGNSLKIRIAITIADGDNALAKAAVESAVGKCFTSNSDDCLMKYSTSAPNYNQLYADLVASGRHDFVPANTFVDKMAVLVDPRMDSYFSSKLNVTFPKSNKLKPNERQADTVLVEKPILIYYNNGTKMVLTPDSILDVVKNKNVFGIAFAQADTILAPAYYLGGDYGSLDSWGSKSHICDAVQTPDFPGIMLTYSEIQFYLAEAKERGYTVPGTAESYYNAAITASFDFWGTSGAAAYLAKPEVAYTTAVGPTATWRQKIGLQSWIANYTRGLEAYNTWRRLDYPILYVSKNVTSYSDIPVRFTYPVNEQTLNADQYQAASTAIGGDLVTTKLFWDKY